jgi:hypothetical protein
MQEKTMDKTVTVLRKGTRVRDGMGGFVESAAVQFTSICRLRPANMYREETVLAGILQGQTIWLVTLPLGKTILRSDQLVVDGRTFEVVEVILGHSLATAVRVMAVEK